MSDKETNEKGQRVANEAKSFWASFPLFRSPYAMWVLALMTLAYIINQLNRYILGSVSNSIEQEVGASARRVHEEVCSNVVAHSSVSTRLQPSPFSGRDKHHGPKLRGPSLWAFGALIIFYSLKCQGYASRNTAARRQMF